MNLLINDIISMLETDGPAQGEAVIGNRRVRRMDPTDIAVTSIRHWHLHRDGNACPEGTDILTKRRTENGEDILYVAFRKPDISVLDGGWTVYRLELRPVKEEASFVDDHEDRACGIIQQMLDDCKAAMHNCGLRTLRLDGCPVILMYLWDNMGASISEQEVHAILIDDDGDLILYVQPHMMHCRVKNEAVTGPGFVLPDEECTTWPDSDDVFFPSLLSLDEHIAKALNDIPK